MAQAVTNPASANLARQKKKALDASFFKKGIMLGAFSGITYGLYSALLTGAQTRGVWGEWAASLGTGAFLLVFIIPTIASALNDSCSAIWALIVTAKQGKLGDFGRTLRSKPGIFMVLAAVMGGPIASAAYIVGVSQAGPIAMPVSALCPAIGAILARIFYGQKMGPRVIFGILICTVACGLIGVTSLTGEVEPGMALGLALAIVAALGWGIEGCIAGFGTSMIDSQIGITIRQCTSGIVNLLVVLPIMTIVGGEAIATTFNHVVSAVGDLPSFVFIIASGFCAYVSFASWYIGNSMCGTALGMALNATYTFFGPLFTWILLGIVMGLDGYMLAPIAWFAAVLMLVGIVIIAVNPLDFFRKERAE